MGRGERVGPMRALATLGLVTLGVGLYAVVGRAQQLDICGCANAQSLGPFDTGDPSTWPAGLVVEDGTQRMVLALPDDGVLVFDSMVLRRRTTDGGGTLIVSFRPNARNTPVTLLVKGDLTLTNAHLNVSGQNAGGDNNKFGGLGGPGGFRGGDGAFPLVDLVMSGGAGLGPAGGAPGTTPQLAQGAGGGFVGNLELLPMIGGSGGGGGSANANGTSCIAGGGGGGGGALLISANGTVVLSTGSSIRAEGGRWTRGSNNCSHTGGSGAGGAVRVVASRITGTTSTTAIVATGGTGAQPGRIRLEAIVNELAVNSTDPIASRSAVPGPPAPPIVPTVAITRVGGFDVGATPAGYTGAVDVTLPSPGSVQIEVATAGVPSGTNVDVFVKPRLGGGQTVVPVTLAGCATDGSCAETVSATLAAGTYTIEARATFQAP
jgi:hypothetical protein